MAAWAQVERVSMDELICIYIWLWKRHIKVSCILGEEGLLEDEGHFSRGRRVRRMSLEAPGQRQAIISMSYFLWLPGTCGAGAV